MSIVPAPRTQNGYFFFSVKQSLAFDYFTFNLRIQKEERKCLFSEFMLLRDSWIHDPGKRSVTCSNQRTHHGLADVYVFIQFAPLQTKAIRR